MLYEDMGCLEKVPLLKSKQNFEQIWRNKRRVRQENKSHNSTCPGGMTNGEGREGV